MRYSNFINIILFTVAVLFFNITFSQYSKSHYIPPITSTADGPSFPLEQYIYISTPSESPVNVTIRPLGSEEITGLVSNSNPWAYFIGTGDQTNLIVNTNSLNGSVFNDKGFIVESDNLIYVSVRLFSGGNYQAGTIVSKGTAALGTEFRAGSFENQGFLTGGTPSNYLNFISVLASRDNTTVNFSSFGNGVNILNNQPTENILLNAGESYSVAISPYPSTVNEANAQGLIGALVTSDKPIAVNTGSFTGSNSNYNEGGGQDIGIDQIVPSTIIGNEYIFVRGLGPDEVERPLIVAHEDNTAVSVNGNLETVLNAGDFYSIPSTFYGVSYSNTVYDGFGNVNDDGYPETINGVPVNPFNNADDQPPTNQSSNMYVSTSKPVFAYQVIGGIRPGSQGAFGITNGVANVGLFFVPPLNCKTPSSVNNIPDISQIGNEIFGGIITIVSEAGAEITINGSPISNFGAFPEPVQSNPLYESYTIEGLIGDVSIESTAQVYVATFGAYEYATFGGYYSGFELKPEIILDNLDNEGLNCIPNLTLSLSSISTYDAYQWFYNGEAIIGANSADYTPIDPGYYQISGLIENCEGSLLSNNIPVSDCPMDSDNDGINDNIDIDNDNDGITDCDESLGDQNLTLNLTGGNLDNIGNYSINLSHIPESPEESGWIANDGGFTTNVPTAYINENVEKSPGQTVSQVTFDSEVSLEFYFDISEEGVPMNDEQWYSIVVPFDKTITLLDPNDELRIDSNFDGIFESGITEISNFNIRFKANDENLITGSFKFKTHLTNYFEFQNYNNSLNNSGGVSFKIKATCVPKDSDLDGIVDARDYDSDNDGIPDLIESQGNNFSPLSGIDINRDGYDDIFTENFIAFDFDNDNVPDYLDLDSDNDGIYDLHESGALNFVNDNDLDGLIDEITVGNNGLSNSLEEINDDLNLVYSINDFDGDSFFNHIDLDSEDDGCYDVIEAGFTENDVDGILGDGDPLVDLNTGKVQGNIGYNFVNEDYEISAPIIIDLQPEENITVCENDTFSISFETSTFDVLQWQISYPSSDGVPSWNDITNNLFFSGADEKTLLVTEPQIDLNNVRFRAFIQRNGNSCDLYTIETLVTVNPNPTVIVGPAYEVCDDDYDGIGSYNLSTLNETLLDGQTGVSISYYESQEDADNATNVLDVNYQNTIADTQTLYVRLEVDETGCYATTTQQLIVNPLPEIITPTPLEECDDDYDGIVSFFDLSQKTEEILNGQTGISVSYYAALENAENGENPIEGLYTNIEVDTQTLYVRLEVDETGCYATTTQQLIVNPIPTVLVGPAYEVCDDNYDGIESYDLSTLNETLLDGQTGVSISYYESQEDADNATNVLDVNYQNTIADTQTLYVRLEVDETGCYATTTQQLIVNPIPTVLVGPAYEVCDDNYDGIESYDLSTLNETLLDEQTGVSISYYESQEDADNATNVLDVNYQNTIADTQTLYVRLEVDETGCYATTTQQLIVNPIPTVLVGPAYEVCDDDYDGIGSYNLSTLNETLLDGQTGVSISYYESQEDADNATNVLDVNYQNTIADTQTLYVRLEVDETGCYATTTQQLIVNPLAVIEVTNYELCDYTNAGDLTEVFDITTKSDEILNGQDVVLTYFTSLLDSQNNINPIANEELVAYSNTDPTETIYVTLEQNTTGCVTYGSFDIIVNPLPNVIENTDLVQCDIDDVQDGISIYNLEEAAENIVIGDDPNNYVLTFHLSQEDLDAGINIIEEPTAYVNETPLQNIYCRVENINTGCYTTSYFYLETVFNPIPDDAGLVVCDDSEMNGTDADYNGLGLFTLSDADEYVLSLIVANPNNDITDASQLNVSYYLTEQDALLELNQLPNEYISEVPNQQVIYLRVERGNDCFGINSMTIEVLPVPEIITPTPLEECDDDYDGIVSFFDLSQKTEEILNGQTGISVSYYETLENAESGENPIEGLYTNIEVDTQTLYVQLIDDESSCISSTELQLIVNPIPTVLVGPAYEVCDDDYDGIGSYNLSTLNETLLDGQTGVSISYYESQEDADNATNVLDVNYQNTIADTQTLYVRLEVDETGCYATTTQQLIVNPLPEIITPTPLEECDDDYDGIVSFFDLSQKTEEILNGQTGISVSYYETLENAENGENPIEGLYTNIEVDTQTLYVRLEVDETGCYATTTQQLIVNPIPIYTDIINQILCTDTPGFFDIILSDYDIQVLNGQNPDQYVISYHTSADDAENGVNALENAYTVVDQIDLFVRIEDNITACYISNIDFTLTVEPKPLFTPPDQPIIVCDEDTDGFTTIDISIMTEDIMRGPDGAIIEENIVTYHETAEDMNLGANAIEDPAAYVNIANPQIVYVRIEDNMTPSTGCYADTTLELIVQTPPVVNEPSSLEYCDPDADGFGVFDLTTANVEIANGLENLVISYHETEVDAENNVNAIVNADEYNNIVADVQTVYIRVEDNASDNDCASQLTLTLIVNDVPQINTEPSSLSLCDENADGFGIFDLSTSSEELLNGLDPNDFTITYYEAEDDAENALNAIVTPYNYTNTTAFNQFVWVRIENNITACYNLGSIELIINELPILTQPSPLNLCDDNNNGDEVEGFTLEDSIGEVLQGQTGINISFHESQEDADNAVNPIVSPYNNTANAQTIYIRGEDEITGCYATITLDLRVNPIPSPITPEPIEECDDDNDGFTFFTLETNEEEIINGELDIILSYYSTLTNAQNDVNPIISPYYNIVPDNQIIYVRAENELTGCFTIVEQELITIPSPEIPLIIEDIVICDDDYDDIALFDLTQREEDILGEQSSSEVILTYHESLLDAETGDNPIINTTSYQNLSNPQTIYVRLEDTVNGCINTGTFNLVVTLPPVIVQADPLQVCDDEIADQITEFDLTIKDSEITGGNIDWEVIYYETQQDAFNAINPIENPEAYSNTSVQGNPANPQTLYVAVVNEFGCIAYNYLTIEVLPNPTPNLDPSNIEQCDNNNAGDLTETFDITIHEDYILNGESGVSIAYHESLDDALSGINPITGPSNYVNVIPGVQTIYVAVTKNITGCVTVVTFDIIVNPLPDISSVADIVICEVNTDNIYDFDLDEITVQLLGSQDISNFTVTYHETQQDAEDGLNVLTSPYTNTTSPQQLFVNISNNTTGCFVTGAGFTLDVQEAAVANTDAEPALLEECDIDNDGFAQFILTGLNQDILDGLDANDFTVGYYENLQDAEDSSNALPNNYTNTSSPQIIYVRLDNDTDPSSQCYDITTATLIVNELPFFSLEASYMGCENANGSEVVDSLMETNFPESEYDFEWYDPTGTLVATTSSYFPTMAGTYTATVTNELTGCQFSTTTEVYTSATAVVSATVTTLAFAQEHVIQATATGIGDYEFRLDTGPWQLDGTFNNVSPGLHTVYVRDLNGCGMGTATVLVVDYPRFFTPNGDGYNDTWHIIGADLHPGLVTSDIYIFDRYGKLLKKLDPQGDGWDGTYNGRPMPSTDYWFTIEYQIPALNVTRRFRAHFSLKR